MNSTDITKFLLFVRHEVKSEGWKFSSLFHCVIVGM